VLAGAPVRLPAQATRLQQADAPPAPQIVRLLNVVAFSSPSWCDNVRLLDSTPVLLAKTAGITPPATLAA